VTRAIIVGSGMAGLTVAAYLARDGCEVDVFEQDDHIGGVTATLRKEGFAWDLGPLMVEGFAPGEPAGEILAELGCADRMQLVRGDRGIAFPDYRLFRAAEYLGPYWRRERLKEIFPHEADGLDRYYRFYDTILDLMTIARRAEGTSPLRALPLKLRMALLFRGVKEYQTWNAQQVMDRFFSDPKLKAFFLGILADFVVCPSEFAGLGIPAVNQETAFDSRLPAKVSSAGSRVTFQYVAGGCGNLVEAVASVIRENGGRLHTSRPVRRVLLEGGRVRGVELADGERREADLVLVSGGARECFFKLVEREALPADFASAVDDVPLMESVFMVHLGVDMDPSPYQDVPLNYYYGTYDIEDGVTRTRHAEYHEGKSGFLIYIPSFHSPSMAPPGQHAITIYTIAPNKLDGGWQARRQEMTDKLLHEAEQMIPGLREHARVILSLTPADFGELTYMQEHHSFGGICPVMGKSGAPYRTPFRGLWFLGAQSESGGGVHNVMHGARKVFNLLSSERPT
jgi:phytoene dehydrogenase-like protein